MKFTIKLANLLPGSFFVTIQSRSFVKESARKMNSNRDRSRIAYLRSTSDSNLFRVTQTERGNELEPVTQRSHRDCGGMPVSNEEESTSSKKIRDIVSEYTQIGNRYLKRKHQLLSRKTSLMVVHGEYICPRVKQSLHIVEYLHASQRRFYSVLIVFHCHFVSTAQHGTACFREAEFRRLTSCHNYIHTARCFRFDWRRLS